MHTQGCHNSPRDDQLWLPLPLADRRHTPETRDKILNAIAKHRTPTLTQLELDNENKKQRGAIVNDRGASLDCSKVPARQQIARVQDDPKRSSKRGVPPLEHTEQLLHPTS